MLSPLRVLFSRDWWVRVLLLGTVWPLSTACAPLPPRSGIEPAVYEYFAVLDEERRPGAAVLASHRGETLVEGYFGQARLDEPSPVSPSTRFNAGSIAKQLVGYLVWQQVLEGKLDAEVPLQRYLEDMPDFGRPNTLRDLLHHTSGLRDGFELLTMSGWRRDDVVDDQSLRQVLRRQRSLNHPPGAEFSYTNSGYILLAEILETVTGTTLAELARQRIFAPLAMEHSYFLSADTPADPKLALSYEQIEGQWHPSSSDSIAAGAGGLITTARDLTLWLNHLLQLRARDDPLWEALLQPGLLADGSLALTGRAETYGAGLFIGGHRGELYVNHGGGVAGYRAAAYLFPHRELAVVALMNAPWEPAHSLALGLADRLLPTLGAKLAPTSEPFTPYAGPVDRELVRAATGYYTTPQPAKGANLPALVGIALLERHGDLAMAVLGDQMELARPIAAREFHTLQWSFIHLRLTPGTEERPLVEADFGEGFVTLRPGGCELDEQDKQALSGRYWSEELQNAYYLEAAQDRMEVTHPRQGRAWLLCLAPDVFLAADAPVHTGWGFGPLEVSRGNRGEIDGVLLSLGERTRRVFFARQ